MDVDLEPCLSQQSHGASRRSHVVASVVETQDLVRETLVPDLNLGRPESAHPDDLIETEVIWTRFDDQADASGSGGLVGQLL